MCDQKGEAKTKTERIIDTMDRLVSTMDALIVRLDSFAQQLRQQRSLR